MAGFGPHHAMHSAKSETLAEHLPIRIEFIETAETVDAVLPTLYEMVSDGLIEVQDTTIVKAVMKDRQPASELPHEKQQGPARMLRIYMGEGDLRDGETLYEAIVKRLRMIDISGATVYRGILGFGAKGETHKERFLHISSDLPILITVVDTPQKIAQAIEIVESLMDEGLIVTSDVDMIRLVRANPLAEPPATEPEG